MAERFVPTYKIVKTGKKAQRSIDTYHLSMIAFLKTTMVINVDKSIVAAIGKVWIAKQTIAHEKYSKSLTEWWH